MLTVCIVPASGPAWPRAVRADVPPSANDSARSCSISDAPLAVGAGDLHVPQGKEGEDLWVEEIEAGWPEKERDSSVGEEVGHQLMYDLFSSHFTFSFTSSFYDEFRALDLDFVSSTSTTNTNPAVTVCHCLLRSTRVPEFHDFDIPL